MDNTNYEIEISSSHLIYEFLSSGPKGQIKKQVVFKPTKANPNIYNLGFGDVRIDGKIDDKVITNNKDSRTVLTTVALTLFKFFEKYPDAYVFAIGSTKSRTRLYQIGISNNLGKANLDFEIYGSKNKAWELFRKGVSYDAFLVKRKNT